MGLGKPQLHAKFEVAGFIYYGNIRESVFKRQIRVRGNVRTASIARCKARTALPIRDNWTFLLALTADALIRRTRLCWRGWVTLGLNISSNGYIHRQHIYTIGWEWFCYNFAAGSFYTKKLCSRVYSIWIDFIHKNDIYFLIHPLAT